MTVHLICTKKITLLLLKFMITCFFTSGMVSGGRGDGSSVSDMTAVMLIMCEWQAEMS